MKKKFLQILALSLIGISWLNFSCTKPDGNNPPIALAGLDLVITLPTDSILLDGSASNDPEGTISRWLWTKISGPDSFSFTNRSYFDYEPRTIVRDLIGGCYQFELKVTDAGGLISRDTMRVSVLANYDLDINLEGTFSFSDNFYDFFDDSYYDLVSISGTGNFAPIGLFEFKLVELSDTTAGNRSPSSGHLAATGSNNSFWRIPFIGGTCTVFLKQVIQGGGGPFTGTLKVNEGSAKPCNQSIYITMPPLTISGSVDTTAHTINLNVKGKTYF